MWKGKPVNIPVLLVYAWQHKLFARRFWLGGRRLSSALTRIRRGSSIMLRTRGNLGTVLLWRIPSMPGAHENGKKKNHKHPYPEPALVPLGEKPQV